MSRRLGIIGYGQIAKPVVRAVKRGHLPGWNLVSVLARTERLDEVTQVIDDVDQFFSVPYDLIVEAAGPAALAMHGPRSIMNADVWTISGAALCDSAVLESITLAGARHGHRLRVLSGAVTGLDGVNSASVDGEARVHVSIVTGLEENNLPVRFSGAVRDAGERFPNDVNVAAAAALAGPGMDATVVDLERARGVMQRQISIVVQSRFGDHEVVSRPVVTPESHPVAACLIAALRNETRVVWVG